MISQHDEPFLWGLISAAKPPDRLPLSDLATREVYLSGSQYGAKYDLSVVPAHAFVLNAYQDTRVKEIANVAVTGFGKTTIFEVCISFGVAQDPGDTLLLGNNDKLTKDWMESRMLKVLKRSPWTREFLPSGKERNDAKKTSIIFRHMALFTGGANESNTQEKSMRYCLGDECWEWKDGMIGHFLRRHHNRLNRKMLLQSQGGDEGTEWHDFCKNGKWHDGHHRCPACKEYQPITVGMIRYEKIKDANGELDWPRINETIRCVCPGCEAEFEDTDYNRRQWSKCMPVWNGNKHFPDRETYSWTFMTVWTKSWAEIVKLWIQANAAKKRGNLEPMRQFINKEMGQFWSPPSDVPSLDTGGTKYSLAEYIDGEEWPGEAIRYMRIDVQKGHFWMSIRAWKFNGEGSRLLWAGQVDTWQTLFHKQQVFGIENRNVYIDVRYERDEVVRQVNKHCGPAVWNRNRRDWDYEHQWRLVMGEDSTEGYQFESGNAKRPRKVWRIYSKYKYDTTACGIRFRTIRFSNLRAKDALFGLIRIGGGIFGIPSDVGEDYRKHMEAEEKREYAPGKYRWVKRKDHLRNDLLDTEAIGMIGPNIDGILKIDLPD